MRVDGVVLAGGQSRRMGVDKARLKVAGVPLAERVAGALAAVTERVVVLGGEPISGFEFQQDADAFAGPLKALAAFDPETEIVFIASCDLAKFDRRLVPALCSLLDANFDAVVPKIGGRSQPLCAVYRRSAIRLLAERDFVDRVMRWLDALRVREVVEDELQTMGLDPRSVMGANTPEELERLLTD